MKTIVKSYFGSHLYGTSTPESDVDFKEIYIPAARDIVLCQSKHHFSQNTSAVHTPNTKDDVDHELFSLKYFFKLASEGETVALDMLHTPPEMVVKSDLPMVWEFIQRHREKFYTTEMTSYMGYVQKQAAKYGVKGSRMAALRQVYELLLSVPEFKTKEDIAAEMNECTDRKFVNNRYLVGDIKHRLPLNEFCEFIHDSNQKAGSQDFYQVLGRKFQLTITVQQMKLSIDKLWQDYGERARKAEANEGIDWKALSHAYRGGCQLLEIFRTGDLKYPLDMAEQIKYIKSGEIPFKIVQQNLEAIVSDVEREAVIAGKNGLRKEVDMSFWDNFVEEVYIEHIKDYYK